VAFAQRYAGKISATRFSYYGLQRLEAQAERARIATLCAAAGHPAQLDEVAHVVAGDILPPRRRVACSSTWRRSCSSSTPTDEPAAPGPGRGARQAEPRHGQGRPVHDPAVRILRRLRRLRRDPVPEPAEQALRRPRDHRQRDGLLEHLRRQPADDAVGEGPRGTRAGVVLTHEIIVQMPDPLLQRAREAAESAGLSYRLGKVLTCDQIVVEPELRSHLGEVFGALAVEEKVERVQKAKAAIYTAEELADQERLGREAGYGR